MLHGREVDLSTVSRAVDAGLAYVTEDRKQLGLLLADDVRKEHHACQPRQCRGRRVIDDIKEFRVASDYRNRMRIRCSDVYQTSGNLSGGNQQKVVLSKWLFTDPEILILDEPTRGIDIGAKYEIYCIINELADAGKAVIVISSEMPELLGICDRNLRHERRRLCRRSSTAARRRRRKSCASSCARASGWSTET